MRGEKDAAREALESGSQRDQHFGSEFKSLANNQSYQYWEFSAKLTLFYLFCNKELANRGSIYCFIFKS